MFLPFSVRSRILPQHIANRGHALLPRNAPRENDKKGAGIAPAPQVRVTRRLLLDRKFIADIQSDRLARAVLENELYPTFRLGNGGSRNGPLRRVVPCIGPGIPRSGRRQEDPLPGSPIVRRIEQYETVDRC